MLSKKKKKIHKKRNERIKREMVEISDLLLAKTISTYLFIHSFFILDVLETKFFN